MVSGSGWAVRRVPCGTLHLWAGIGTHTASWPHGPSGPQPQPSWHCSDQQQSCKAQLGTQPPGAALPLTSLMPPLTSEQGYASPQGEGQTPSLPSSPRVLHARATQGCVDSGEWRRRCGWGPGPSVGVPSCVYRTAMVMAACQCLPASACGIPAFPGYPASVSQQRGPRHLKVLT